MKNIIAENEWKGTPAMIGTVIDLIFIYDMVASLKSAIVVRNKSHVSYFVAALKQELDKLDQVYGEVEA